MNGDIGGNDFYSKLICCSLFLFFQWHELSFDEKNVYFQMSRAERAKHGGPVDEAGTCKDASKDTSGPESEGTGSCATSE